MHCSANPSLIGRVWNTASERPTVVVWGAPPNCSQLFPGGLSVATLPWLFTASGEQMGTSAIRMPSAFNLDDKRVKNKGSAWIQATAKCERKENIAVLVRHSGEEGMRLVNAPGNKGFCFRMDFHGNHGTVHGTNRTLDVAEEITNGVAGIEAAGSPGKTPLHVAKFRRGNVCPCAGGHESNGEDKQQANSN